MEIQVQELIDKIKKDGIESAAAEAARLKREAEAEAARIVEAARKEAADIVERGKADAERFEKAANAALQQASRNLVLAFKQEIQTLLDRIVAAETASAMGADTLKAALPDMLKAWAGKDVNLIIPEAELGKIEAFFNEKLAAALKGGIELKADRNLAAGFRVALKDGSAYYDFSAEAVSEQLSAYLNPRLAGILSSGAKGL